MVMLMSLNSATSLGESATNAPYCVSCSALALVRLWTTRSWPASKRLPAMAAPMIPSPTKPILSGIMPPAGDDRAHVPLHLALQGIFYQHEALSLALQAQEVQRPVGEAEQALGGGARAVDLQLYLPPVHPRRTLGEPDVRYRRAIPDEHDRGDLPGADSMPPGSFVGLAALVVGPEPRRQVDVAFR